MRDVEFIEGFIEPSEQSKQIHTEPVMGGRVSRIEVQCAAEVRLRFGPSPLAQGENKPQRALRLGQRRIDLESAERRSFRRRHRLRGALDGIVAVQSVRIGDTGPGAGEVRVNFRRALKALEAALQTLRRSPVPVSPPLKVKLKRLGIVAGRNGLRRRRCAELYFKASGNRARDVVLNSEHILHGGVVHLGPDIYASRCIDQSTDPA